MLCLIFAAELIEKPLSAKFRRVLLVLMLIYPLGVIVYFLSGSELFATIGDGLLMVVVMHTLYQLFPRSRVDENPHLRRIANVMMILLAVFSAVVYFGNPV